MLASLGIVDDYWFLRNGKFGHKIRLSWVVIWSECQLVQTGLISVLM